MQQKDIKPKESHRTLELPTGEKIVIGRDSIESHASGIKPETAIKEMKELSKFDVFETALAEETK